MHLPRVVPTLVGCGARVPPATTWSLGSPDFELKGGTPSTYKILRTRPLARVSIALQRACECTLSLARCPSSQRKSPTDNLRVTTMSLGFYRLEVVQVMQRSLDPWAFEHLRSTIDGDVDAAERLMAAARNDDRGLLAIALWRCRIAPHAYRAVLGGAWDHDHDRVIHHANGRRRLRAMFRYAAFQLTISRNA